jgi:hypothetical protein
MSYDQAVRDYEARVQQAVASLGSGSFRVEIDEAAYHHMISDGAIANVILPELNLRRTCPPTPGVCTGASRALLLARTAADAGGHNKLLWKWRGVAGAASDFGDPTTTSDYALCFYDDGVLVKDYAVAAGGDCGNLPCWRSFADRGFRYNGGNVNPDGIAQLQLKSGPGGSKLIVRGEGVSLPLSRTTSLFTQATAVTVQLVKSNGPECWQAVFSSPSRRSTGTGFYDRIP